MDAINSSMKSDVGAAGSQAEDIDASYLYKYSTGILSLDQYLGVGGVLGGRIINVSGWEASGKTLTALVAVAAFQKEGKKCAFLDAEGTFSPDMARAIGVNVEDLMVFASTPEKILTGEDYFMIMGMLIQAGVHLIVVDSTPALIPTSRLVATIGQGQKAVHAAMMSEGLQQITTLLNAQRSSVVWFINQIRGVPMAQFGPSEDYTGGYALRFYQSYAISVKKEEDIIKKVPKKSGEGYEDRRIGVTVVARLTKNKTSTIPVKPIQYDVYFETVKDDKGVQYYTGVDTYKDMVETGVASGVIQRNSSWFNFETLKTNGSDKMIEELRKPENAKLVELLRKRVLGDAGD
jgi:recombination protein RecA